MSAQSKDKVIAIGIRYLDVYPKLIKFGGIHNFIGPKIMIGQGICVYDDNYKKLSDKVDIYEDMIKNLPELDYHLMYGDKVPLKLFEEHNYSFLSVDFASYYEDLNPTIVSFWDKWADLLFFSIKGLEAKLPVWINHALFHCADGVIYQIGDSKVFIRNEHKVDGLTDFVGAGDFWASTILNTDVDFPDSIDLANKETANFLRARHEKIQSSNSTDG